MRSPVTVHNALLAAVVVLAACDNFALADQYQLLTTAPLSITAGTFVIQQGETTILEAQGGTAPYAYSLPGPHLFYHDDGAGTLDELGVNNVVARYTASESIGIVIVRVADSGGVSHEAPITIRAATPRSFAAAWVGGAKIRLTWDPYSNGGINLLRIERSTAGGSYGVIETSPAGATSFEDHGVSTTDEHSYRIYALAAHPDAGQEYDSAPARVTVPLP